MELQPLVIESPEGQPVLTPQEWTAVWLEAQRRGQAFLKPLELAANYGIKVD